MSLPYVRSSSAERIPGARDVRAYHLPDKEGSGLLLEEVIERDQAGAFEPMDRSKPLPVLNRGFGGERWFRIDFLNRESRMEEVVLDMIWRVYDVVELYQPHPGGGWSVVHTGASTAGKDVVRSGRWTAFDLALPPGGEMTVYLRVQDYYRLPNHFLFWPDRNDFVGWERFMFGTYMAYFCLWTGMLAYGIFLYALLRERAQWHYLLFAAAFGFFYLVSSGMSTVFFLWPTWPLPEMLCAGIAVFALYHLCQFARYFLGTPREDATLDGWLRRLRWLPLLSLVALPAALWPPFGGLYLRGFIGLGVVLVGVLLWAGIRRWRAGRSQAVFILLAFSPYLFGLIFWLFNAEKFVVPNDEQRLISLIGNALSLIFLSFAAAYRHRLALIENSRLQVRYTKSLEREVQDRTRVLQELSDRLTLTLAERDRVMTIIGHDLRAPAASLLALTRLLADDATLFSPKKLASLANEIGHACDLQLELLNNLLMWGKTQTGDGQNVVRTEFSAKEELNSVWRLIQGMACTKQLAFHDGIPADLRLHADPQVVQTILRNLLVNAVKFTPPGGWIKVRAVPLRNGSVELSVQDNGVGISPKRLTALFSGAVKSTPGTCAEKGTGIGLNLSRDLARTLGGDIRIESLEGGGTTVFLVLP